LKPGDVLFIPKCWIHAIRSLEPSIGVNVFFRTQDAELYPKQDVWGNADLVPFQQARDDLARAVDRLAGLPAGQRQLYLKKLGSELCSLANDRGGGSGK
jgi:ribosomal protein L16 Arg81 hydroxylase